MAMTKKERAEMDAAITRAETLAALRWTEDVKPDLPVPEWGQHTEGWIVFSDRVEEAWSESVRHGLGRDRSRGGSQRGMWLHSTRSRALKALRHQTEMAAAERLRAIDIALRAAAVSEEA